MSILILLLVLAAALLIATRICFNIVFDVPVRNMDPHELLEGKQYIAYRKETYALVDSALKKPYEEVSITSFDGLKLWGHYYETAPGAPVEVMMHGYRSTAIRDFCGGLHLALEAGHNVLLVDQRAHGKSEGKCLTFGVYERRDCLSWVNYAVERFGPETKVILVGVSMGAATVLMATELPLPENVVGVIADCGYTSPRDIIWKVGIDRHYPPHLMYPLVRLAAFIWGGFHVEECGAETALRHCKVPVLLIHGDADHFVPCDMSRRNYEACASDKTLLVVPNAGHALSYVVDPKIYTETVKSFLIRIHAD